MLPTILLAVAIMVLAAPSFKPIGWIAIVLAACAILAAAGGVHVSVH